MLLWCEGVLALTKYMRHASLPAFAAASLGVGPAIAPSVMVEAETPGVHDPPPTYQAVQRHYADFFGSPLDA